MAFQQEYFSIPPITRAYTTACLLTTIAVVSEDFFMSSYRLINDKTPMTSKRILLDYRIDLPECTKIY